MARYVGVVRLSRETDESTSPERQRQIIESWVQARGDELVGWAADLGVSASLDPWDRPQLGSWLRGELGAFDGLVAWRVDRLARRVIHFAKLLEWARTERREIASATEGFDLSTPLGRMFAQMIAMLAEGELEAIKERAKGSYEHLVKVGRHRGGFVPYGYKATKNPDGNGFVLVLDPVSVEVIRGVVSRVLRGESINSIVTQLNEDDVPSSLAWQRIQAGRPPENPKTGKVPVWRVGSLAKLLRSDTLLGYIKVDGRFGTSTPVDEAGLRVRRAEPVLDRKKWDELQATLDSRDGVRGPRERSRSAMLLRVAYCACGNRMYLNSGRSRAYYRCASKAIGGRGCLSGVGAVSCTTLEGLMEETFLDEVGDLAVEERVFVAGEDHSGELAEARAALGRLAERLEKVPEGPAADAVIARMTEHTEHIKHLASLPNSPSRWVYVPTEKTYRSLWSSSSSAERGKLLRDSGVRLTVAASKPLTVDIDLGDLRNLAERARRSVAEMFEDD